MKEQYVYFHVCLVELNAFLTVVCCLYLVECSQSANHSDRVLAHCLLAFCYYNHRNY